MTSVYDACVESDFCLFLGAGASKFAGYPMMKCLTEKVINVARNGIDGEGFACLEHFKRPEILKLDIESILSQQRDLLKIAELSISGYRLAGEDFKAIQNLGEKARVYSKEIVRAIYEAIRIENCKYDKVKKYYSQLLSALSESFSPFQMIPIITTNYDLIIESLEDIEDKEVNVYDGWRAGSAFKREWSFVGHKALEIEYNKQEFNIGLFKIHGSLNWFHSKKKTSLFISQSIQH